MKPSLSCNAVPSAIPICIASPQANTVFASVPFSRSDVMSQGEATELHSREHEVQFLYSEQAVYTAHFIGLKLLGFG